MSQVINEIFPYIILSLVFLCIVVLVWIDKSIRAQDEIEIQLSNLPEDNV